MITKHTKVIFIDELSPSILDVDDWKILTQGGFTACGVKYKTARSFFNRSPIIMTAQQQQQQLKFRADNQLAMDRRLRYYVFKSLPNPKKKAAQWLRKHPMECIAWAASKVRVPSNEEESTDETDEEEWATKRRQALERHRTTHNTTPREMTTAVHHCCGQRSQKSHYPESTVGTRLVLTFLSLPGATMLPTSIDDCALSDQLL
ncbi:hypothetical protein OS493_006881 [Desmophyllum pertusum]|uniref:Uncharacterized protein n=1 Tax=Desmophyllum pertusum TaxID=174260 RepID=A0A9X0D6M8_9CNID|nr:hypothetical protein OS493_006881 [Desmophyllum pertusum]